MADAEFLIPNGVERPVAVLAHPDDESLWCAGLLSGTNLPWTVICCSIPPHDRSRAWKFFAACDVLGVKGKLLPYDEPDFDQSLALLNLSGHDFILTHGEAGEYGHRHHKQLHAFVRDRWPYATKRYIGYGGPGRFTFPLDERCKAQKLAALKCYDGGDKPPQWKHLLANYGKRYDLWQERYD